jgi:hypothetical protein
MFRGSIGTGLAQRENDGAERIDMGQWIDGEPSFELGGRIATFLRHPSVRIFMENHRKQEGEPHIRDRVKNL